MKKIWEVLSLADILLFLILVLLSMMIIFNPRASDEELYVAVLKDNILLAEYPLNTDRVYIIDEHSSLEIKDHRVRMLDSDCPDKRCVKQGYTNSLPIICLPNHVVVEPRSHKSAKPLILQ